jgi:hypothetical protein
LGPTNVKSLLLYDKDYSTPADHYFGYIMKRKIMEPENEREKEVLDKLDIDKLVPRPYNIELLNSKETPKNIEEMDIFDLAR